MEECSFQNGYVCTRPETDERERQYEKAEKNSHDRQ